jgi:MSHA biogenesis protein MshL
MKAQRMPSPFTLHCRRAWPPALLALAVCAALRPDASHAAPAAPARGTLMMQIQSELGTVPDALPKAPGSVAAQAGASVAERMAKMDELSKLEVTPRAGSPDQRFDLNVANAAPVTVFSAIVHDARLSILVDPGVKGPITVNLRDVTLREALESLQALYGYEYRVIGHKIIVEPEAPQTRIFKVDYPALTRTGRSDVRVLSGSIAQGGSGSGNGNGNANNGNNGNGSGNGSTGSGSSPSAGGSSEQSSRVSTQQSSNIWGEIEASLKLLLGEKDGNQVVVSPQTGTIVVRARPKDLRMVQQYLDASKLQVERQVMLEAKIISVTLNDAYQTGINWAAFKNSLSTRASGGTLSPGAQLSPSGTISANGITVNPGTSISAVDTLSGGLFGLAFQTANFAAVLNFLESQGGVQVLSSPRIATLNNQQAVLKVGTDDFFVTNISTTTSSVGSTSTTSPTISVQPFFSGIALDVTPEISDSGEIILHIHPQVSVVSERNKVLNLGSLGSFTLPLASSDINESDSVVRVSDGRIFAIGGLMRQQQSNDRSGLPGTGGTILGNIFGQTNRSSSKQELVILLKPTVVNAAADTDSTRVDALDHLLKWFEQKPAS